MSLGEVFAVDTTSVQLTWSRLPRGRYRAEASDGRRSRSVDMEGADGPAALTLDGWEPGSEVTIRIVGSGGSHRVHRIATLAPPGPELARIATLSDLHLGSVSFGRPVALREPGVSVHHPLRCARRALADLVDWGAAHLFIKGDLVDSSTPLAWEQAATLIEESPIPVTIVCGNHEKNRLSTVDAFSEAARHGIELCRDVTAIDLDGLRVVLIDSARPHSDVGRWAPLLDATQRAVDVATPALVLSHHQPQRTPIPTYYPPGVPSPIARTFVRAVREANPAVFGSSGHTHRHRRHRIDGVPWTETGSPKDFPGTWTGYTVHADGIVQSVHRVSGDDCLPWLERSGAAALGTWRRWSPGRLADRCFGHTWPISELPRATAPAALAQGDR